MSAASSDPEPYRVTQAAYDARVARWRALAPTLTCRAKNVILNADIDTVEQLHAICPTLHLQPNCGKRTCQELYAIAGYVRPYRYPTPSLETQEHMASRLIALGWTVLPPWKE